MFDSGSIDRQDELMRAGGSRMRHRYFVPEEA